MMHRKAHLTLEEQIKVAYWHIVRGYPQHDLAAMYDVNQGRVAEAVGKIRKALTGVADEG